MVSLLKDIFILSDDLRIVQQFGFDIGSLHQQNLVKSTDCLSSNHQEIITFAVNKNLLLSHLITKFLVFVTMI